MVNSRLPFWKSLLGRKEKVLVCTLMYLNVLGESTCGLEAVGVVLVEDNFLEFLHLACKSQSSRAPHPWLSLSWKMNHHWLCCYFHLNWKPLHRQVTALVELVLALPLANLSQVADTLHRDELENIHWSIQCIHSNSFEVGSDLWFFTWSSKWLNKVYTSCLPLRTVASSSSVVGGLQVPGVVPTQIIQQVESTFTTQTFTVATYKAAKNLFHKIHEMWA